MERGGFHGYRNHITNNNTSSGDNANIPLMINSNNNQAATMADDNECTVREQDRFMPIANVIRIMRKILPPHAKISDDAKETIQECVSEYISFITGEANERCQREQRKTITAEDVLWAMSKLGFDDYIEPLTLYLHRYRETEGDRTGAGTGGPSAVPGFVKRGPPPVGLDYLTATTAAPYAAFGGPAAAPGFYQGVNGFYGYFKDATGPASSSGGGSSGGGVAGGSSQVHAMASTGDQQLLQFK